MLRYSKIAKISPNSFLKCGPFVTKTWYQTCRFQKSLIYKRWPTSFALEQLSDVNLSNLSRSLHLLDWDQFAHFCCFRRWRRASLSPGAHHQDVVEDESAYHCGHFQPFHNPILISSNPSIDSTVISAVCCPGGRLSLHPHHPWH